MSRFVLLGLTLCGVAGCYVGKRAADVGHADPPGAHAGAGGGHAGEGGGGAAVPPHGHQGEPSGSHCPPVQTLGYADFAAPFMQKYCLRCHSEHVTGPARMKAPPDHDFDRLDLIQPQIIAIDMSAAIGATAENRTMPPTDPKPTDDERRKLGEWLACGAPLTPGASSP